MLWVFGKVSPQGVARFFPLDLFPATAITAMNANSQKPHDLALTHTPEPYKVNRESHQLDSYLWSKGTCVGERSITIIPVIIPSCPVSPRALIIPFGSGAVVTPVVVFPRPRVLCRRRVSMHAWRHGPQRLRRRREQQQQQPRRRRRRRQQQRQI